MSTHGPINGGDGEQRDAESAATLERFGATLRSTAVWEDPPADLESRILSQVGALRAGDGQAGTQGIAARAETVALDDVARRRQHHAWVRPALAIAAAALVAFAAGALLTGGDDDDRSVEPIADVELSATEAVADASADGTVVDAGAGYAIYIDVAGLPPAPDGAYYEGWLHDEDSGDWVSVGTFHMRGGDSRVVLWAGVPVSRYRELVVTSEVEGSTGGHGEILLAGPLQHR